MRALLAPAAVVAATVATALVAGTFFVFAVAVVPALARTDARSAVATMQAVNVAIVNPWFLSVFLGSPLLTAAALLTHPRGPDSIGLGVALVLALAATVVTIAANVPLNDALAAAGTTDPDAARAAFLAPWGRWNLVRTLCATGATAVLAGVAVNGHHG